MLHDKTIMFKYVIFNVINMVLTLPGKCQECQNKI